MSDTSRDDSYDPSEDDPTLKDRDLLWNKIAPLSDRPDAPRIEKL